jgi:signal transduction histidine kinase
MKHVKGPVSIFMEQLNARSWSRVELIGLLLLFMIVMSLSFFAMGIGGPMGHLLLPFGLVVAVVAVLRFRFVGALAVSALLVVLITYAWLTGVGFFAQGSFGEHLLFVLALLFLFVPVIVYIALIIGYSSRTKELALEHEGLMHRVLDALPVGVWVSSRNGRTIFANERWASFSSMSLDQIMSSDSQLPPVDLGEQWANDRETLFNSDNATVSYQTIDLVDENERLCSMTLLTLKVYINDLLGEGSLSLLVDETALRLYAQKSKNSEYRLRMALSSFEMGFWEEDMVSGKVFRDANWFRILGLDADECVDCKQQRRERIHPDDQSRVFREYEQFFEDDSSLLEVDYRSLKGSNEYIWVEDRVLVQERDVSGRATRIMGTIQDISARKRVELDLKQAKDRAESANRAKGHFIATISHEIRTPLNAIIGLSSFLNESDLNEDQLELSQTIYSSGKNLLLLVNDVLDFSKIESGRLELEMQEFPLHLCFEDCVKLFKLRAVEQGVALRLTLDQSLPEFAFGDMQRLRQIVQNLLANALKFTEEGGVVISVRSVQLNELPLERRPDPLQRIGYLDQADHDYLEVLVSDSGIGVPAGRQDILFEAFSQVDASTTRKYGGTGLGLAICKRLVDAMGGRIWLDSREGAGSVFGFVVRTKLIREIASGTIPRAVSVERIVEQHPCDILVVGAFEEVGTLLSACRQLGYTPHHAPSYDLSADAFQLRSYNLVFVGMGQEAAGFELSRQLCSALWIERPQAVLGVTVSGQVISKGQGNLVGMRRVISGNIDAGIIREVILDVMHEHD